MANYCAWRGGGAGRIQAIWWDLQEEAYESGDLWLGADCEDAQSQAAIMAGGASDRRDAIRLVKRTLIIHEQLKMVNERAVAERAVAWSMQAFRSSRALMKARQHFALAVQVWLSGYSR